MRLTEVRLKIPHLQYTHPFDLVLFQENLVSAKLKSENDIKQFQTELACVAATNSADEFAMTSTIKTLQTEKDTLLDDKCAQQLQNDAIISNLNNELHKLKLKPYANEVAVINLLSPERNSTPKYQNGTNTSKNVIAQPLQNDAAFPNNDFPKLTYQSNVIGVEAINLAIPERNSTQEYCNETHNMNTIQQHYVKDVEAINLASPKRNSQTCQNAIQEENVCVLKL